MPRFAADGPAADALRAWAAQEVVAKDEQVGERAYLQLLVMSFDPTTVRPSRGAVAIGWAPAWVPCGFSSAHPSRPEPGLKTIRGAPGVACREPPHRSRGAGRRSPSGADMK